MRFLNNLLNKTVLIAILLFVSIGAFSINVPTAEAVSIIELQQYIKEIKAQILELQKRLLAIQQGKEDPGEWCHTFNNNLRYKDTGTEVVALQTALKKQGFADAGKDPLGKFGTNTFSAVVYFQNKFAKDILSQWRLKRGTGFVGASTRAKLNQFYGCKTLPMQEQGRACAKEDEQVNRNPFMGSIDRQCCEGLIEKRVSESYSICEMRCAEEGESVSAVGSGGIECCQGLSKISRSKIDSSGNCSIDCVGVSICAICANCGNGICGLGENKCNCPEDCEKEQEEKIARQDSTSVKNVLIDSSITRVKFSISWAGLDGSDLDLTLRRPDDRVIDPDVAETDSNIRYTSASSYEIYTIELESPMPGEWEMRIFGVDVPADGEEYAIGISISTDLTMNMYFDRDDYSVGEPIKVNATLADGIYPITGASVIADIDLPLAASSAQDQITLFDDGMHGDGMANDGVYGNFYTSTNVEGAYQFAIKANGARSLEKFKEEEFERIRQESIYVSGEPIPGLSVSSAIWDIISMSDMSVEKKFILESSSNTIATILATDLIDGFGNVIELSNFGFNPSILHLPANEPQEFIASLSIPLNSPVGNYTGSIIITTPEGALNIEIEAEISNPAE